MRWEWGAFSLLLVPALAAAQSGNSPTNPTYITPSTEFPTYVAADNAIANTGAGDIFCLAPAASTKRAYINEVHVTGTASAAIVVDVILLKRAGAPSGGTPVAETVVPLHTDNPTSIVTATGYTSSPTPASSLGNIMVHKIAIGVQGNTAAVTEAQWIFGSLGDQAIRDTSPRQFCLNVSAAGTGASYAVYMKWTER